MKNESSKQFKKQALSKTFVSGLFTVEDIKKAIVQYRKECLPDSEIAFHYETEVWVGLQKFAKWLKSKDNNR